jgi:hypothetical protein
MGAWSHESFGNDDACDWVAQLEEHDNFCFVESTLDVLLKVGGEYLEAPEASEAIAAAEVVARSQGNFGSKNDNSQNVNAWVERVNLRPPPALIDKTCRALDRILTEPSELMELWGESEESEAWQSEVKGLRARVRS